MSTGVKSRIRSKWRSAAAGNRAINPSATGRTLRSTSTARSRTSMRIDVHQHLMPPFYAGAMEANGGDPSDSPLPKWSPELAIDYMDSHQIRTGILSLSAPSVVGWRGKERREMARRVNEYTADLVAKRPARFGNFATVPLPDVE